MALSLLLDMAVDAHPDRVAIGPAEGGLTYAQLQRAAAGGAAVIREHGARHVAFVGVNGPALPLLLFAAARAGVPFTPLNYRLSTEQLRAQVSELPAPLVVADAEFHEALGGTALDSADWLTRALATEPADEQDVDDESAAVVLFTSGTTSKPKGVLLKHENLVSYVLQTVEFASAEPEGSVLISVPPYHIAGVGTVLTNVFAGRRMVYLPAFTAESWLDLVRTESVTNAMVVPTMLSRIVDHLAGRQAEVPALCGLAYGGARMPRPVLVAALEAFPEVGFVNAYGLTETSSTIAVLGPDDHRDAASSSDPQVAGRLGSVGRLVPGMEAVIRDELGDPVPAGTPGELWVRGPQVSGEYVGQGSVLDTDGWFPTRDRAWFDEDGYLFIEGRSDDTIIRGGENIAPAEIEDVLVHHPGVREAAVLGVPDDEWGERIVAALVAKPGVVLDPGEVREYVRARLRGSRTPDDVVVVDELPHSPTGKLLRRELRSALLATS
jgi:acyl-CoA synthetase (AMP-forming)/AMP-acid ligase II